MNTSILSAKRRSQLRRREGGAAMFIVAMTLSMLATLGVYALAAASNEQRTSGNERQAKQTHFLAEYGVLGAAQKMNATTAQYYMGLMLAGVNTDHDPANQKVCISLLGIPSTADALTRACRRLGSREMSGAAGNDVYQWINPTTVPYAGLTPYQANTNPGSFGPTPMTGDFFVELSSPNKAMAPSRYDTSLNFCFIQLTATSVGLTQPIYAGNNTAVYGGEGQEIDRARFVAGPVQCPR